MRRIALVGLVCLSSCSWVFMQKPNDTYAHTNVGPQCTDTRAWAILDLVFAGASVAGAVVGGSGTTEVQQITAVVSGIGWAVIHTTSAVAGFRWAGECREAKAEYLASGRISPHEEAKRRELERQLGRDRASGVDAVATRGFYCTATFCVRDQRECQSRTASNPGECALIERAWCTAGDCYPTHDACVAVIARTGSEFPCAETV